jgi:hypothetical protein
MSLFTHFKTVSININVDIRRFPLADVAAAVARTHGPIGSAATARESIQALAAAHGADFVWCPAFNTIHDLVPAPAWCGNGTFVADGGTARVSVGTVFPFFPPAEESPIVIQGRRCVCSKVV